MLIRTDAVKKTKGILRRQCTHEYKIVPVNKWIGDNIFGRKKFERWPKEPVIEKVFGISYDEMDRCRDASAVGEKWAVFDYPLVRMKLSRDDVIAAARKMFPGYEFPRSACIGCPYHNNEEWRRVKASPEEWKDAVEFDHLVRNQKGLNGKAYLHKSRVPLELADLGEQDNPYGLVGVREECEGMCGN
jgi:hypothetical protein